MMVKRIAGVCLGTNYEYIQSAFMFKNTDFGPFPIRLNLEIVRLFPRNSI